MSTVQLATTATSATTTRRASPNPPLGAPLQEATLRGVQRQTMQHVQAAQMGSTTMRLARRRANQRASQSAAWAKSLRKARRLPTRRGAMRARLVDSQTWTIKHRAWKRLLRRAVRVRGMWRARRQVTARCVPTVQAGDSMRTPMQVSHARRIQRFFLAR